jgi:hypothetical protein
MLSKFNLFQVAKRYKRSTNMDWEKEGRYINDEAIPPGLSTIEE